MSDIIVQMKDQNGNNLYPVGVGDFNNYSTSEQRIGTWIDGKPLYRKVVDCGAAPNNTTKQVNTGISYTNSTFVGLIGMAVGSSYTFPINGVRPRDNLGSSIGAYITNTSGVAYLTIDTTVDRSAWNVYITLTYTKNT